MSFVARSRTALVLAAHGSAQHSEAEAVVREHAVRLSARGGFDEVAVAFHQGTPTFATVLDSLSAERVVVVPFMTSAGHFSDVVLPEGLRQNRRWQELAVCQAPPVGLHPGVAPLVARRVGELIRTHGLPREETVLAVVGHGTARHEQSRDATLELVEQLRRRQAAGKVIAAFLDDEPRLEAAFLERGRRPALILPFLIGGGGHATQDIPRRLGLDPSADAGSAQLAPDSGAPVIVDAPFGTWDAVTELLADLGRRHLPQVRFRYATRRPRQAQLGSVALVGAGPGDPGLITVRGLALLRGADVVLHDRLICRELLDQLRPDAEVIDAGKRPGDPLHSQEWINGVLVERARAGRRVVRLKGGDPMVFGRGGEELEACRTAGIPCEVVPGVSSALAVPAAAGIPVTLRGVARSCAIVTASREGDSDGLTSEQCAALALLDTVVVLMARASLGTVAAALISAGRDAETPVACIQDGTTPNQRVVRGSLGTISELVTQAGLEAPMIAVIGEVATWAETAARPLAAVAAEC